MSTVTVQVNDAPTPPRLSVVQDSSVCAATKVQSAVYVPYRTEVRVLTSAPKSLPVTVTVWDPTVDSPVRPPIREIPVMVGARYESVTEEAMALV